MKDGILSTKNLKMMDDKVTEPKKSPKPGKKKGKADC